MRTAEGARGLRIGSGTRTATGSAWAITSNERVLVFVRRYEDDAVLVVANLAESAQPALLDLPGVEGCRLVEMINQIEFPPVVGGPYFLTLAAHTCHWFQIVAVSAESLAFPASGV